MQQDGRLASPLPAALCYNPPDPMNPPPPNLPLVIAAAAIAGVALYVTWARLDAETRGRRITLVALRAVLLGMLVLAVADPVLRRSERVERSPLVLLALDTSPSMTIPDANGAARLDAARSALAADPLADALRRAEVARFAVGETARPVAGFAEIAPATGTDLRASLSAILRVPRDPPPAACILLSDGADGSFAPPARVAEGLGAYGVPVFCLSVGSPEPVPDASLPGLVAPRVVAEGERFELRVLARAAGLTDRPLALTIGRDGQTLARRDLPAGETERPASFELTAAGPGYHRYVAEVAPVEGEATPANNRRSVVVRVEPRQARLLLIEGHPRREYTFLRRLLLRIEDLETVILLRKRAPAEFWLDAGEPRRASLAAAGELSRYRAIVLANVEAGALGAAFVSRLADYVTAGGALAMLGGEDAFGAGGWAGTPLASALPVRPGEGMLGDPVSVRLGGDGELARELRATGVTAWERLPLLDGMNSVGGASPGAEVALEGVSAGGAALGPVLAAGRHGAGRTLALTVADTWRWQQSPDADEHSRAAWDALWATVIGWLIAPRAERQVVLELGRDSVETGEPVRALVSVRDTDYQPVADAAVEVTVSGGDEQVALSAAPTATPGQYAASFPAGVPGEYRAQATARRGGSSLGSDAREFEVTEPLGELTDAARPDVLAAIADATGGRALPLAQAGELAELLPLTPTFEERTVDLRPARTLVFFLVVLAIGGADWLLRRRWGVG